MKSLFLLAFGLFCNHLNAQSVVQLGLDTTDNKIEYNLSIDSEFLTSTIIDVKVMQVIDADTLISFQGVYDFAIQDPSNFSMFSMNSETNEMNLFLGQYDPYNSFVVVKIINEGQLIEEFTLN